jgi:hypothetical protein
MNTWRAVKQLKGSALYVKGIRGAILKKINGMYYVHLALPVSRIFLLFCFFVGYLFEDLFIYFIIIIFCKMVNKKD